LQGSLAYGFRPGMGHVLPDRMFWAHDLNEDEPESTPDEVVLNPLDRLPPSSSKH